MGQRVLLIMQLWWAEVHVGEWLATPRAQAVAWRPSRNTGTCWKDRLPLFAQGQALELWSWELFVFCRVNSSPPPLSGF